MARSHFFFFWFQIIAGVLLEKEDVGLWKRHLQLLLTHLEALTSEIVVWKSGSYCQDCEMLLRLQVQCSVTASLVTAFAMGLLLISFAMQKPLH